MMRFISFQIAVAALALAACGKDEPPPPPVVMVPEIVLPRVARECVTQDAPWVDLKRQEDARQDDGVRNYTENKRRRVAVDKAREICRASIKAHGLPTL